jgi:hypothetical protein
MQLIVFPRNSYIEALMSIHGIERRN